MAHVRIGIELVNTSPRNKIQRLPKKHMIVYAEM